MRGEGRRSIILELSPCGDPRQEMEAYPLMRTLGKKKKLTILNIISYLKNRMKRNPLINLAFYHIALIFHKPAKFH